MKTLRRTTILALVLALLALPTAAIALDEPTTDTDRATRDTVVDAREHDRPDHDLSEIKKRALEAINRQLEALGRLRGVIANARHITEAHADQLLGDIARAAEGLETLARKIEAATTPEELRALIEQIDDYQIGHVLAPKTHQVIASDSIVYATGKLERYADKLGEVIARFEEAGFDVSEAWRLLAEMKDHTIEAYRLGSPVAGNVIGLQPEDWPDPAKGILAAGREDLHAAGTNVRAAHGNATDIVAFLRGLMDATTDLAPTDA